jgi:hypothetical protein
MIDRKSIAEHNRRVLETHDLTAFLTVKFHSENRTAR